MHLLHCGRRVRTPASRDISPLFRVAMPRTPQIHSSSLMTPPCRWSPSHAFIRLSSRGVAEGSVFTGNLKLETRNCFGLSSLAQRGICSSPWSPLETALPPLRVCHHEAQPRDMLFLHTRRRLGRHWQLATGY